MNTGSEDLNKHLGILQDRLTHPTDYEQALSCFLEEFAGNIGFIQQSLEDETVDVTAQPWQLTCVSSGKPTPEAP